MMKGEVIKMEENQVIQKEKKCRMREVAEIQNGTRLKSGRKKIC
jgi:hypothetical protein